MGKRALVGWSKLTAPMVVPHPHTQALIESVNGGYQEHPIHIPEMVKMVAPNPWGYALLANAYN